MTNTQHYNAYMSGDLKPFMPEGADDPSGRFHRHAAAAGPGRSGHL
jgi:hypothetical protein